MDALSSNMRQIINKGMDAEMVPCNDNIKNTQPQRWW